jgi:hypothetical protein
MSLSRVWLVQDQPEAAQALLAEIYGWFTEGWKTADLQAAKGVLGRIQPVTWSRRNPTQSNAIKPNRPAF